MIDNGWPALSHNRKLLLLLAIVGLGYLLLPGQPGPARFSNWNGLRAGLMAASGSQGIVGVASARDGRNAPADADVPFGNPLGVPNTVMTQGYGVGSHAPAHIWGGIDLAVDGDGDGEADPKGTWNAPVYATHSGVARIDRDSWPAGNHIWIEGVHFKTGYSHLSGFAVQDGQQVERGQLIGYIGSTGMSSGPHLDYQVWKDGVNVNPLDYAALPGR